LLAACDTNTANKFYNSLDRNALAMSRRKLCWLVLYIVASFAYP